MHNLILVINADDRDSANEFCNSIGAQGETFTVALFDSSENLAGYWCGWNVDEVQEEAISANQMFRIFDTPQEALQATGWHVAQSENELAKQESNRKPQEHDAE